MELHIPKDVATVDVSSLGIDSFPCFVTGVFRRDGANRAVYEPGMSEIEQWDLVVNVHTTRNGPSLTGLMAAPGPRRDASQELPDIASLFGRGVDLAECLRVVVYEVVLRLQGGLPLPLIDHGDVWVKRLTVALEASAKARRRRYTYLNDDKLLEIATVYAREMTQARAEGRRPTPTKRVREAWDLQPATAERWVRNARTAHPDVFGEAES